MPEQYDLIAVGGGIGGATLAKCLAEKGARALVLERQEEFKDRVRGELTTPWGVAETKQLGIYDLLRERIAREVPWVDFHSGNTLMAHRDIIGTTPHQQPCLSGPSRTTTFFQTLPQFSIDDVPCPANLLVRRNVGSCQLLRPYDQRCSAAA